MAGGLGFCALDRRRDPLVGDEIRGCWEAAEVVVENGGEPPAPWVPAGFVEMDETLTTVPGTPAVEPRWSLWGEPDR